MATPQSTASQDEMTGGSKKLEQITFRFCSECSNMLYPKEDEDGHKLQFTCRTCQYTEDAQTTCVFRNVLNTSAGETAGVTQDVGSDPTVSDSLVICLYCGHVINPATCGEPAHPKTTSAKDENKGSPITKGITESDGLAELICPWDQDPFDDYDEEPMLDERSSD